MKDCQAGLTARRASIQPLDLASRLWGGGLPRLLLIHGLADGAFVWNAFIHSISCGSGIAVDLRGHGDSPRDSHGDYRTAAHVADILKLIDEANLTGLTLIGHSLGAEVAIHVAAAKPARVRSLIMVDGGPNLDGHAARALQQQMTTLPTRFSSVAQLEQILTERHPFAPAEVLCQHASAALRDTLEGDFELKFDPAVLSRSEPPDPTPLWNALHSVRCPKLIVRGAASAFLPLRRAAQVCESVQDCRLATVPRAGHSIPVDNPPGLAEAVARFLSSL